MQIRVRAEQSTNRAYECTERTTLQYHAIAVYTEHAASTELRDYRDYGTYRIIARTELTKHTECTECIAPTESLHLQNHCTYRTYRTYSTYTTYITYRAHRTTDPPKQAITRHAARTNAARTKEHAAYCTDQAARPQHHHLQSDAPTNLPSVPTSARNLPFCWTPSFHEPELETAQKQGTGEMRTRTRMENGGEIEIGRWDRDQARIVRARSKSRNRSEKHVQHGAGTQRISLIECSNRFPQTILSPYQYLLPPSEVGIGPQLRMAENGYLSPSPETGDRPHSLVCRERDLSLFLRAQMSVSRHPLVPSRTLPVCLGIPVIC